MKTSSFCGLQMEVQKDSTVVLSLETPEIDLLIHMDREEFLMFLVEAGNVLTEAKQVARKLKQDRELQREKRR